jgi:hypothetical protein
MVTLFTPHDENSVRYRWKVPDQKLGEFWLLAKLSENSNKPVREAPDTSASGQAPNVSKLARAGGEEFVRFLLHAASANESKPVRK